MDILGSVGSSTPILFNKVPYIDIEYPIAHITKNVTSHRTFKGNQDIIRQGLNFFDTIVKIEMKDNQNIQISDTEMSELISLLKGGVIYNGN